MRKSGFYPPGKPFVFVWLLCFFHLALTAQTTFPVNGVADLRTGHYAFTNVTLVKDAQTTIANATLVVRDGKITAAGSGVAVPADATVIDGKGKFIYPSFIDIYSDYGIAAPQRAAGGFNFFGPSQFGSNQKGAFGWNQAIRSDVEGDKLFNVDDAKAKSLRDLGFGTVLTHQKDGIARGTGTVVTLANEKENLVMLKEKAAAFYSFSKGVSTQSYPGSLMGSIALLRQTYIDANWYKSNPEKEGVNLSLKSWNAIQSLPQIFEANDKWADLRAYRIGKEFGVQYIIKGGGNEYQRMNEIAATKATYILPLNYPAAMDADDPNELRFTGLDDLKHWELAPTNPAALEKAGLNFCITTSDLTSLSDFTANLRKAIEYGLSEAKALEALTKTPASLLGVYDKVGSLEAGKVANFLITSGPIFDAKTVILQNWVQGKKYAVKEENWNDVKGTYNFAAGSKNYTLELKDGGTASFISKDTLSGKYSYDGKLVKLSFTEGRGPKTSETTMSGVASGNTWSGAGRDGAGNAFTWTATYVKAAESKPDSAKSKPALDLGKVTYPFLAYGSEAPLAQETILIKNATVWTSDQAGKLEGTDVLVKNGKIAAIGKNLSDAGARVIDGTGKHLTAGIIDEHSHIAAMSINEGGQSVTSEVRIADNLNPEDINIYRQLSGGVTTSHILHGSANTIGGQTQLIKLRWGADDEGLKFKGADPFIKFALGENVKRSPSQQNNRFPDTRMGVEQVLTDAFQRAADYQASIKKAGEAPVINAKSKKEGNAKPGNPFDVVHRDLELDALVEIMNKKRFITCHSYVQSEITSIMRVTEKFGFPINTFTHILEGYKVADKMKAHGANASTFSDWWQYKMEVVDAIPQNASIMSKMGLNVAINSDDAEMARRLNQEAAKSIKYAGMSEEDALKMVTINPAKMLHVDDKVGSIKVGKDADLVLWNNNPLSIYAVAEKTIVDGTVYFDRERDAQMRKSIQAEKARLIAKLAAAKKAAGPGGAAQFQRARPRMELIHTCMDHYHSHGLLAIDVDNVNE
ncbi:amidohydrolase family protein [Pseudoflavitalea sp. G-6-1-2]|uniref:amidohydrolase family protein n=1 Tax=Pseudoflavitalea sp. G-6-1-2 TaxID=2728841 RepID=UPI00146B16D1|nr:amidohydrolase family protein [Pseudoflavitalea sp. G-6-1-2]NML22771.1 amidohydrolase family protein [Pseudoflavitalea sp. G-6-1-2]